MREQSLYIIFLVTVFFFSSFSVYHVNAQVQQSINYQIQNDSINFGGGLSTSTNYRQESTFGEISTGESNSALYRLKAGYQQMQEVYLALSGGSDVVMDGAISGVGGGMSNGSTTLTAITDSPSGYQLTIKAANEPAMQSNSYSIDDYVPSGAVPDIDFTISSTDAYFGFSPFGNDTPDKFKTNGSACNISGVASTTACWEGLSTTTETIAIRTSSNHPAGTATTLYFKVGIGSAVSQPAGVYTATSTVTLLAL